MFQQHGGPPAWLSARVCVECMAPARNESGARRLRAPAGKPSHVENERAAKRQLRAQIWSAFKRYGMTPANWLRQRLRPLLRLAYLPATTRVLYPKRAIA